VTDATGTLYSCAFHLKGLPVQELPASQQIGQMIVGNWVSQLIYVAAKLDIAGLLKDGARSVNELAGATKTHRGTLYRVLRALAGMGIFAEQKDGKFAMTPLAQPLRGDVPGSQRAMAIMNAEICYPAYGSLLDSVKTGATAFENVFGKPVFDWMQTHEESAKVFDDAMVAVHGRETGAVIEAYDFAGVNTLADVGGGNGSLLFAVLQRHGAMRGVLFDLPGVIERAKLALKKAGIAERCQAVGGSFFETIPSGADAYMLRHIIHDWDEDKCVTILKNIGRAMKSGAKVLLIETIIPPGNEPSFGKLLDITMLTVPGGMERTEAEYHALLERAGLKIAKIVKTNADVSVIEAVKA